MKLNWFGLSTPTWWIPWPWINTKRIPIKLFSFHNRQMEDGHYWGIGILFVYGRHLAYVGDAGITIGFINLPRFVNDLREWWSY